MGYTLVLDEGTTSTRAIVFDDNGNVVSIANRRLRTVYPKTGWVEQPAEEIYARSVEAMEDAIEQCGCTPEFMGITNQRETVVAWDPKTGEPFYNAVVWRDKRGYDTCKKLENEGYEPVVRAKTGLVADPYFSASKIKWLIDNVPEISKKIGNGTVKFGTIDSYLVWKLTGNHFTEPSNASRTMLFDINSTRWDPELLEVFGVKEESLPEVKDSNHDFGVSRYGRITGILGDQQSSLFGNGCVDQGRVKCTYGTGAFVLANYGKLKAPPTAGLLKTIAWRIDGEVNYALEGSILASGEAMNWLKRLQLIKDDMEIESLSRSVDGSDGLFFVPALDGLGAPRWQPEARGLFVGMSSFHTKAHIVRAVLDSMAFSVAEVVEAFERSDLEISKMSVDGGGAKNSLLVQTLSNALGVSVERAKFHEMTAYGAFLMALIGSGRITSGEIDSLKKDVDRFDPLEKIGRVYSDWKKAEDLSIEWSKEANS